MKECFLFLLFMLTKICSGDDFSIVSGVLDDRRGDVLAAFGDFNADKLIDIFVISSSGLCLVHLPKFCSAFICYRTDF